MTRPRPAVDRSANLVDFDALVPPIAWSAIFGDDAPVELEIGSGKGLFLANAAAARPDHRYLGVELARKYAGLAAERLAKRSLSNAKVLPGDARRFLNQYVPAGSVRTVHIYFPDPWWKTRHRKRRVFCDPFVVDVAHALEPGGEFHIATDVEEYFGVMGEIMAQHPEFEPLPIPEPHAPEHELDYLTNFERKYRIEGRPIYRSIFRLAQDVTRS